MKYNHSLIILSLIIAFVQTSLCQHSHSSSSNNTDPQGHSHPSKQLAKLCDANRNCPSNAVCPTGKDICRCVADYEPDSNSQNCVKLSSDNNNNGGGLQLYREATLILSFLTATVSLSWNW